MNWDAIRQELLSVNVGELASDELEAMSWVMQTRLTQAMAAVLSGEITARQCNQIARLVGQLQKEIEARMRRRSTL
jgi:hypothetical protein